MSSKKKEWTYNELLKLEPLGQGKSFRFMECVLIIK